MKRIYGWKLRCILVVVWLVSPGAGCSALQHVTWPMPTLASPDSSVLRTEFSIRSSSLALSKAEIAYATAMEAKDREDASCVDEFFRAAQLAWDEVEQTTSEHYSFDCRASEIYRSSLNAIVIEGQKHQRLDPRRGLRIRSAGGWSIIPVIHHGFPRSAEDFDELAVVGNYAAPQLNQVYRRNGVGVPVIAARNHVSSEPFQRKRQGFAATLVLRPMTGSDSSHNSVTVLELYDPLRISHIAGRQSSLPLSSDITAPIARALSTTRRSYVQSFLQPGVVRPEDDGLFMLEPYQSGKIPVIFVHGLLSDRLTWTNMVNELNARPEFIERYQLWGFEYPTGEPFLTSAAHLRHQLEQLRAHFDPHEMDTAFHRVVLVGHSMGGLISKVQIAESGSQVWDALSNQRFEQVAMSPDTRKKFTNAVFFKPSPLVSRVIFIGTPHAGSVLAQRAVGRIGSLMIKESSDLKAEHDRLLTDNPTALSSEFRRRVPTSVDILEPDSELLQAINCLSLNPRVQIHSLIGQGRWMPGSGDSDGVVPVSSANHARSVSVTMVTEKHTKLTENPEVIEQVLSILREHHSEYMRSWN